MSAGRSAEPGAVFEVLSDPTRRQIITWLAEDGPLSATRLSERLPLTRQGVAKHLLLMAESGIVMQARVGREVRFSIEAERLGSAAAWLSTVGARWDRRLASLEAHVSSHSTPQD